MPRLKSIMDLCKAYAGSTGVSAFVIDDKGRPLEPHSTGQLPRFCQIIHENCRKGEDCRRAHLYGSYQAERFGEAYTFFCPFGLVHWIAPVMDQYRIVYSLVSGPVLMSTPDNALINEVLVGHGLTTEYIAALHTAVNDIPYFPPQTVNHLTALLYAVSCHLSNPADVTRLEGNQAFFEQQADISTTLYEMKNSGHVKTAYPLNREKDLLARIRLGDKAGAQELLNEIFGFIFFSRGNDLQFIKTRVTELVVLLSRAALEGGADNGIIFGLNCTYLREIEQIGSIDEIAFWLSEVMTRFTECVFNLHGVRNIDTIYKAVSFLRENYMRDITLEDVARAVNLSPAYFSKVFKEEIKTSFRTYLNSVRIENAKRHLYEDAVPLVDIAALVGFQDQSYFSRVFKKISGVTPGEYRRTCGLRIEETS